MHYKWALHIFMYKGREIIYVSRAPNDRHKKCPEKYILQFFDIQWNVNDQLYWQVIMISFIRIILYIKIVMEVTEKNVTIWTEYIYIIWSPCRFKKIEVLVTIFIPIERLIKWTFLNAFNRKLLITFSKCTEKLYLLIFVNDLLQYWFL